MIRDVGVGQLVRELEQRGARLPFEIGAFVALEACEGLLQDSVTIEPDDVRVTLEGAVVVAESARTAEPDEAARSLVSVLARLLVAAGPGVPPELLDLVSQRKAGEAMRGLHDLHDAIEAALIPINRGASRRVLARLVRESDRAPAPKAPEVDPKHLDAELDELLRDPAVRSLEPSRAEPPPEPDEDPITEPIRVPRNVRDQRAAPPGAVRTAVALTEPVRQSMEPITATIRKWQPEEPEPASASAPASAPASASAPESAPASAPESASASASASAPASAPASATESAPASASAPDSAPVPASARLSSPGRISEPDSGLETATESVFAGGAVTRAESIPGPEPIPPRQSRPAETPAAAATRPSLPQPLPTRRGGWGIWILAAALGLVAYALTATDVLDKLASPPAQSSAPLVPGVIDVAVTPSDAQIFVFIGRGPAVANGLAVDAAHEFIVFDQGLRPSRAIVPKGATWTSTERGPLYELAVQTQPINGSSATADLGIPETEPQREGNGPSGAVRVITNPPAAKVYRFVGTGPSVRLSVASIHEGQELLVYREGYETRRAVIGPSDWEQPASAGEHRASVQVQLPAVPDSPVVESTED